jgi:hypothetical protein
MDTAQLIEHAVSPGADLLPVQLQIARRADEIAQSRSGTRSGSDDWNCWIEAEKEVLSRLADLTPA